MTPFRFAFFIIACTTLCSAYSPEELRNFFEWGEYRQLIDSLESDLTRSEPCGPDSQQCARYHYYLGVALYGVGRITDAQVQFRKALMYQFQLQVDSTYLSTEVLGLFAAIRADLLDKQSHARMRDSLRAVQQEAFAANVQAIRSVEIRRSRIIRNSFAGVLYAAGVALGAAAIAQYYKTRNTYGQFSAAAAGGDRVTYDLLQPEIRMANGILSGLTAGGIFSVSAAIIVTVHSASKSR
jgi:hypothetical protein